MRKRIFKKKSRGRLAVAALVLAALLIPSAALAAPPANDEMASATSVSSLPFASTQLTNEATSAPSDPNCFGGGRSVWYSFTATEDGWVAVDTFESNYDTTVGVYTASNGQLSELGCNDNAGFGKQSRVSFEATSGSTYHFMVASLATGVRGTLRINVREALSPAPNDDVATVIESLPFEDSVDAGGSTASSSDPDCASSEHTVWYSFTPESDVRLIARTSESPWDTVVAAYEQTREGLKRVVCTDAPDATFNAKGGTTYLIMVGSYFNSPAGDLHFSLDEAPAPIEVEAKISKQGKVRKVLGGARVTISIRCSDPSRAHISGLIRQRRNQLVDGFFNKSADCSTRWTEVKANATSYGRPFKVGKAVVRTDVFVTSGERSGQVRSRRVVDLK